MDQESKVAHALTNPVQDDEINLLEYLLVIARHWRLIAKVCLLVFVLACLVSLLMPNKYVATTRLMPPNEGKGGLAAMLGGMGELAALAGVSAGGSSGDLYVGMLKSRTVADAIIDRFQLMEVYDVEHRSEMHKKLERLVKVNLGKKDGIITVSVEDKQPQRSADIANAYVDEVQKLNLKLSLGSASRQRAFLEERLTVVKQDLSRAEEALRVFQKGSNAIKLDDQAKAIIETIAQLKGQIVSKEVELGVARSFQTDQSPEVRAIREGLAGLRGQLRQLEQSSEGKKVSGDIFISTTSVPDVGLQYARVMREFKVQETLYELLTKQFEIAKIEEARDTPTLQVLDLAVAPDRKSKPARLMNILTATFLAGFSALIFVFFKEYYEKMNENDERIWIEIKKQFVKSKS